MKRVDVARNLVTIALLIASAVALPAARADEANQAIKVTFDQAVQIPGRVLPAGTYWFMLPEEITDHYIVRIYSSDHKVFLASVLTTSAERLEPTDGIAFTLAKRGSGEPQAIVSWFYPGRLDGHEFVYSKQVEKELAKNKQVTVMAGN